MRRMLVLSITLILGFSTSSWAQERAVNPGEDPNEAKITRTSEADVGATGVCKECVARMKHTRLKDDTTFRPGGPGANGEAGEASKQGTK